MTIFVFLWFRQIRAINAVFKPVFDMSGARNIPDSPDMAFYGGKGAFGGIL